MAEPHIIQTLVEIPSQTSLDERVGLSELVSKSYTGSGYIFDIGTAAGGSTFCLAHGLRCNEIVPDLKKEKKIIGFDLFEGYSLRAFQDNPHLLSLTERLGRKLKDDMDFFLEVTKEYKSYIQPVKVDLTKNFAKYRMPKEIEIAHIDAAKSLILWKNICPIISDGVMPGLTTFVFQDFERCRLPWQWLFTAELLKHGIAEWAGFFTGGTIHLRINKTIPEEIWSKSTTFQYEERDAVELWRYIYDEIVADDAKVGVFGNMFEDISKCTLAYIYKHLGSIETAASVIDEISPSFFLKEKMYATELNWKPTH